MTNDTMAQGNVAVAFALVAGSGLATAVGASVVFFPSLVKMASRRVLAAGLGFAAGVMIYVSFVEIFFQSVTGFTQQGYSTFAAYGFAVICFFCGVASMVLIDLVLRLFSKHHHHHHHEGEEKAPKNEVEANPDQTAGLKKDDFVADDAILSVQDVPFCACCLDNPGGDLDEWQRRAREEEDNLQNLRSLDCGRTQDGSESANKNVTNPNVSDKFVSVPSGISPLADTVPEDKPYNAESLFKSKQTPPTDEEVGKEVEEPLKVLSRVAEADDLSDVSENQAPEGVAHQPDKKLIKMGLNTAVAIAIHNFPEGLATFVAALGDSKVGAVLAIAIGIHNIPEGLCVAMPIYYATGNRWKAFGWALLSGLSEPFAALLGWLVLANVFSPTAFAVLFGLTGGMMVIISVKELLPTAHRYDEQDTVVTYSFIFGMMVMALSLVLFQV